MLPRFLDSEKRESKEDGDHNSEEKAIRDKLVQLERLLVHANIPVSGTMMILGSWLSYAYDDLYNELFFFTASYKCSDVGLSEMKCIEFQCRRSCAVAYRYLYC